VNGPIHRDDQANWVVWTVDLRRRQESYLEAIGPTEPTAVVELARLGHTLSSVADGLRRSHVFADDRDDI
jgi:hypothetical protein